MLELLARRHRVDLLAYNWSKDDDVYIRRLQALGVRVIPANVYGWLRTVLRVTRYDFGLIEYWHLFASVASTFRQHQPWAKLLIDSVDVHFVREEAAVSLGLDDGERVAANRRREVAAYQDSDGVIVITPEDRGALNAVCPRIPTYLVPIIVPLRPRPALARRLEVLFVGGFKHQPNVDGLFWFVRDVWPLVRGAVPSATLAVVGSHPPPEVLDLSARDGITVAGYVPDTGPYLDRAAVSIAPLRFGGGMKGKVTEAMASGVPVVTTSVGAAGFGLAPGEHALLADAPGDFATAVTRLLLNEDEANRLGEAGRKLVAARCTPDAVATLLESMVAEVVAGVRRPWPGPRTAFRSMYLHLRCALHALRSRPSADTQARAERRTPPQENEAASQSRS